MARRQIRPDRALEAAPVENAGSTVPLTWIGSSPARGEKGEAASGAPGGSRNAPG